MVFRVWFGNAIDVGETVKATATPVPLRFTVWVLVPIRIVKTAILFPADVGRKVAVTVQLALAAREVPQVRASVNWFAFVPDSVGAVNAKAAALVLRIVTARAVRVFSRRSPNARDVADIVNGEGALTV